MRRLAVRKNHVGFGPVLSPASCAVASLRQHGRRRRRDNSRPDIIGDTSDRLPASRDSLSGAPRHLSNSSAGNLHWPPPRVQEHVATSGTCQRLRLRDLKDKESRSLMSAWRTHNGSHMAERLQDQSARDCFRPFDLGRQQRWCHPSPSLAPDTARPSRSRWRSVKWYSHWKTGRRRRR